MTDEAPYVPAADEEFGPNEIDFDDERDDDQLPLDVAEAREADVLLDDPEKVDDDTELEDDTA
jgi:hypothetical protein